MKVIVQLGDITLVCDDDQPGIASTPEQIEDIAHRLGRQAAAMLDLLPDPEPVTEDGE